MGKLLLITRVPNPKRKDLSQPCKIVSCKIALIVKRIRVPRTHCKR